MRHTLSILGSALLAFLVLGCDDLATNAGPSAPDEAVTAEKSAPASAHASNGIQNFVAPLSGRQEVPPNESRARGLARFQLNKAGTALHFKLNVANIDNVIGAHIHRARPGRNGPILVFLFGSPFTTPVTVNGTLAEGTITAADVQTGTFRALLRRMRAGRTYVNVHTSEYPAGEIRGQIDRGNGVR